MHLLHVFAAAAPNDEPSLRPGLDPDQVTPGAWGFFATFFLAAAIILLIWDMARRIRRVRYRQQVEEAAVLDAAERKAADQNDDGEGRPRGSAADTGREFRLQDGLDERITGSKRPDESRGDKSGPDRVG
ncbi:hypothetical protein [Arthrobacter crystallopoietes]|uniref:hypothetical protein n=1 Tax=Crystallibacter crystallopoietes TaxID=37928 RepID=UPI00196B92AE|nr:hypothetical protein [Arthrobacter crystallopoietes]QTG79383.1 hypothetical protein J5251_10390 [Arthrobacter crystallopoietes]